MQANGQGYELLQAYGKLFEKVSLAVGQFQVLSTLAYSSGGQNAQASVEFYRQGLGAGAFTIKAGTIVKTSRTNRQYQTTADLAFGALNYYKAALVESLGQDSDYNVSGPIITADGTRLPGEIDTIVVPSLSPPFAEPNLYVRQVVDAVGGTAPVLDQLGADRGIPRLAGEADAAYKDRARALPDTISPAAIRRHLDKVFYPIMSHYDLFETWENRYQSCWNAPHGTVIHPTFGKLVNWAYNDKRTDRFVPRWIGEVDHRSAYVLVTPLFAAFADRGMAYNDPLLVADIRRAASAWNSPVYDSFSLSGAYNAGDDTGPNARAIFLRSLYDLFTAIKGAGVNISFIPAEKTEPLPGAPYP